MYDVATKIELNETIREQKTITIFGPYLSDSCPSIGLANPLTSHPILAAKLIEDTLTSHSEPHVSTKIPNPCLVPIPIELKRKSTPTINHP